MTTAVYLLNRSSLKSIGGKTSYELWTGSASGAHRLCTFWCVAHVKVTTSNLKKLNDRSRRMIFVGYELGSKAYHVYDPMTRCVHISRDVIFDEAAQWAWPAEHDSEPVDFIIEEPALVEPAVITTTSTTTMRTPASPFASRSSSLALSTSSPPPAITWSMESSPIAGSMSTTSSPQTHQGIEFASPPSAGANEQLDNDHNDDVPLWFRHIDNVLG